MQSLQLSKVVISILLLLTYSFGFAHNLVLHCHDTVEENHTHSTHSTHSTHKHHQHIEGEEDNTEHDHISHSNHFDEGVYDFIICLVQETGGPESTCSIEHCFTINSNDFSLKNISKLQTVIVLYAVLNIEVQSNPISKYIKNIGRTYSSPLINDSPHRGPPFFSC